MDASMQKYQNIVNSFGKTDEQPQISENENPYTFCNNTLDEIEPHQVSQRHYIRSTTGTSYRRRKRDHNATD